MFTCRATPHLAGIAALLLLASASGQGFPTVQSPSNNRMTVEKILLGKALFWDEQLSSTRTVACGTCHIPSAGTSDPRSALSLTVHPGPDQVFGTGDDSVGSPGVIGNQADGTYFATTWALNAQITRRKSPSAINAAFAKQLFWDGRAGEKFFDPTNPASLVLDGKAALESQASGPPVSDVEMTHLGGLWTEVEGRVAAAQPLALASSIPDTSYDVPGFGTVPGLASWIGTRSYGDLFALAFGDSSITASRICMAIATYERTLVSDDSPFDRGQMTAQQQAGRTVFFGKGECTKCHDQPEFTKHEFKNIGVRPPAEDLGLGGVTGSRGDEGKFKTPGLRNVALRAPYFHNGMTATLEDVVEFYDRGGDFPNPELKQLNLTATEKSDLVAFMHALTDDRVAQELPPFDRPALYSESPRVPSPYGFGTAGSGGAVPAAVAVEPPSIGNPNWTLGIQSGLGGANAFVVFDGTSAPAGGIPFLGARLFVGLSPALVGFPVGVLVGGGAGRGVASLPIGIPDEPALSGGTLYLQWLILDAGAPLGLATSDAVAATLF